ncbi:hypothetical protein CC79DRAFT_1396411 [Sarocladium strictum]
MGSGWSILGDEQLVEPRWQEPPYQRGSFQILTECIFTLLLCAWTAIHLNIPRPHPIKPKNKNKLRRWISKPEINWKKVGYLVMAMVAPEIIAVIAFLQWQKKRALWKIVQGLGLHAGHPEEKALPTSDEEALQSPDDEPDSTTRPTSAAAGCGAATAPSAKKSFRIGPDQHQLVWTETHCWYAIIGGFVIKDYNGTVFPLPNGLKQMTLQHKGLEYFLQTHPQVFPHLSEAAIRDKSKANSIAKTLVCLQALWFCANLVGRVIKGLPVTVLELNTGAHCICTLLAYGFWWNKPYDVSEATSIVLDKTTAVKAAMVCLLSWDGSHVKCTVSNSGEPQRSWLGIGRYVRLRGKARRITSLESTAAAGDWTPTPPATLSLWKNNTGAQLRLFDPHTGHLSFLYRKKKSLLPGGREVKTYVFGRHLAQFEPTFSACPYPQSASMKDGPFLVASHPEELRALLLLVDQCTDEDCQLALPNDSGSRLAQEDSQEVTWGRFGDNDPELFLLLSACVLYAAIHALAWNGPFRTKAELFLWRMSVLAFMPFFGSLIIRLLAEKGIMMARVSIVDRGAAVLSVAVVGIVPSACAFFVGRFFLMVESFLALPYAPRGAFEVPNWSAYFPHFS